MAEHAGVGERIVHWARVDRAGAEVCVPRGWLGDVPGLRPHLLAAATAAEECSFLWDDRGRRLLRVEIAVAADEAEATAAVAAAPHGLTLRELQVLTLVSGGLQNAEIATRLGTTRRTVATHVEHVLAKLDVATRTAAAAVALCANLLTLPVVGGPQGLAPTPVQRLACGALRRPGEPGPRTVPRRDRTLRKTPVVIGAVYPSHGPSAADGLVRQKATDLAVAEVNAQGGIGGRPVVHLAARADIADKDSLARALRELVERCPDAITLGYTLAARDDFAQVFAAPAEHGCPVLHTATSASARQLVLDEPTRFGNVFQACAPEAHYGHGFVRTLDALHRRGHWTPARRHLLVLDSDDPNLTTFTAAAAAHAERSGWVPRLERVNFLDPDWTTVRARIAAVEPAAVMIATWLPETLTEFLRLLDALPTRPLVYAIYAPSVPGFLERAGPAAEGLLWATVIGLYQDARGGRFAHDFANAHRADSGRSGAGIHYDMVHLLADAWRGAGNPRDFGAVTRRMRRIVHRGVSGAYYFGSPGQSAHTYPDDTRDPSIAQAHLVHQVQSGRHVILAPGPYATGTFRPPATPGPPRQP